MFESLGTHQNIRAVAERFTQHAQTVWSPDTAPRFVALWRSGCARRSEKPEGASRTASASSTLRGATMKFRDVGKRKSA